MKDNNLPDYLPYSVTQGEEYFDWNEALSAPPNSSQKWGYRHDRPTNR